MDVLRFFLAIGALALILAAVPALSRPGFDPTSVQSEGCRNGDFLCGFNPSTLDELAAVSLMDFSEGARLPARFDLSADMPPPGNQGPRASGVAWAVAYGLKSYQERRLRDWSYDASGNPCSGEERLFSPAFLYNSLNGGKDTGLELHAAGRHVVRSGAATCAAMPYDPADVKTRPTPEVRENASAYRVRDFFRVDPRRLEDVRRSLASGRPVAAGFALYENFYSLGSGVYDGPEGKFLGGHAVVLVGYDDDRRAPNGDVGALKFLNSWSTDWGDAGYGWISYRAFRLLARGAIVLGPPAGVRSSYRSGSLATAGALAAPEEVIAGRGLAGDRIHLTWAPVDGAVLYAVERAWPDNLSEDRERPFALIGYSREPVFSDRGVQADVAFRYRVSALGVNGRSAPSPVAEGFARSRRPGEREPESAPMRVVGLRGVGVPTNDGRRAQVQLAWTPVDGAQAYQVQRFEPNRGRWRVLERFHRTSSYTDTRIRPDAIYTYRVQAVHRGGAGEWSRPADIRIGGPRTIPEAVGDLHVSEGRFADRIVLRWSPVPFADRYRIQRFDASGQPLGEPIEVGAVQSYTETEVDAGEWIGYAVAAGSEAGFASMVAPVFGFAREEERDNETGDGEAESVAGPLPPRVLQVRRAGAKVRLTWQLPSGDATDIEEYFVLRKRAGDSDFAFIQNVPASVRSFEEEFSGAAGDVFFYTVRSRSAAGLESSSAPAVAAFADPVRKSVKKRFFWSEDEKSQSAFEGRWTALDWDGESGPRTIEMEIRQSGPDFEGSYRVGANPSRRFEGEYVFGSRFLEAEGFRMELLGQAGRESVVEITSRQLSPYDVELAFEREAVR